MTSLFQEYEQRRAIKTNPESLIGEQFYWSSGPNCDWGKQFTVLHFSDTKITYQYVDFDVVFTKDLDHFLKHSTHYTHGN
jgi:hypothetical protein